MINWAIFFKTLRDSSTTIIAASLGLVAFVVLFVRSMLDLGTELMQFVQQFGFLRKIFEAGFGIDVTGDVSISVLFAACFTHALVLMLSWSTIIATTTRVTAGEIERGTADLLLTLPVNRREVYFSTSLVWFFAAMLLAVCPVLGVWLGDLFFETNEEVEITRYFVPALNFFCLLIAVGGVSNMVACCVNRRGFAIAIIVAFLVGSVVLNFVEPFIESLERIRFLGLMSYFRPVDTFRLGIWPVQEMITLLLFGLACWLIGMVVFCRKDIPSA